MKSSFYKHPGIIIVVLIISILMSGFASRNTFPPKGNMPTGSLDQSPAQNCANLDVIFLVDQSFGMSAPGTVEASDPLNQRKYAVESMIDLLTGLAFDQCPGTHHRIGVISFGSYPRIDLGLTDIAPTTPQQANDLRSESGIKKHLVADNLGSNDPLPAFVEAWKMFRTAPDIDTGGVARKKVIIFFTNGVPQIDQYRKDPVQGATEIQGQIKNLFPFDPNLLKLETCLSALRKESQSDLIPPEKANQCLAANPVNETAYNKSTYIWTVFLRPPGYEQYAQSYLDVINHYEAMSNVHGGEAIELNANSLKDIPTTFRTILSNLAGVRPVLLNCGDFAVNPYLREARLTVYKISPDIKVTLSYKDDGGNLQQIVNGQASSASAFNLNAYYSFGANEEYILDYPHPGIWQLTADNCQGLDTYYEQVDIASARQINIPDQIPQYEVAPYFDPDDPQYLSYQMRDNETGTIIPQAVSPRFALDVKAVVTGPTGPIEYPMTWDVATQAFRAQSPLQVPKPGKYTVHLTGNTYTHIGSPSPLPVIELDQVYSSPLTLFDITTQFEVFPVTPFTMQIVDPAPNSTVSNIHQSLAAGWPLQSVPLPVRVRLVDRNGNIITSPQDYLASTQNALTAQVDAAGKSSDLVHLQLDPNVPGYFQGEIDNFDVSGPQHMIVKLDRNAMLNDRRPYESTVDENFKRVDTLFHNPTFYPIMLVLLIGMMVGTVIYNVGSRNNKVSGTLLFKDGMTTIVEFNLSSGRNWRVITTRELNQYPQLMLKHLKVVNVNSPRRKQKADSENFMEAPAFGSGNQKLIRVYCVSSVDRNRQFSIDLEPGLPINYGDASFAQMLYEPLQYK